MESAAFRWPLPIAQLEREPVLRWPDPAFAFAAERHPTTSVPTKCMKGFRSPAVKTITSYFRGAPPSMPGDPAGMPGTAKPTAAGRCSSNRRKADAGTWPSITYSWISAV